MTAVPHRPAMPTAVTGTATGMTVSSNAAVMETATETTAMMCVCATMTADAILGA